MTLATAPLAYLADAVGLVSADLVLGDTRERFDRAHVIERDVLAGLSWEHLAAVVNAYGAALTLAVAYEDTPDQTIDATTTPEAWDAYRSQLEPNGSYTLRITVDKLHMLELAGVTGDNATHFFFGSSFLALVDEGLAALESELWRTEFAPALVVIGDTDIDLSGPLLRVVGGSRATWPSVPAAGMSSVSVRSLRDARRELVSVETPEIGQLTPWHFQIDSRPPVTGPGSNVAKALASLHAFMCLVSVCDRARPSGVGTALRIEYRGAERLASVLLDPATPALRCVTAEQTMALSSVTAWIYEDIVHPAERTWTAQRLQFVQVRIASLIGPAPDSDRLPALLRAVIDIDTTKDIFWKAFLEDTIADYLARLRELDDVIDETVDGYGDRAVAITDKLTTNMLAAVATLIGSFIAAAFNKPFNSGLFRVALWTYAGYLAVFPAGVGLWVQFDQYQELDRHFNRRRAAFDSLLSRSYVDARIDGRLLEAKHRWERFFAVALVLYVLVVIAAMVGGAALPRVIGGHASTNAGITPTTATSSVRSSTTLRSTSTPTGPPGG